MSENTSIIDATEALKRGELVVLADNENRENESDLICCAESVTAEQMALIVRYSTGIVCVSLYPDLAQQLSLTPLLAGADKSGDLPQGNTAFAMPVDYAGTLTTGVSAHERASTARQLASSTPQPMDFVRPGHVFPLIANRNGIKERRGHTEASLELVCRAGRKPVAVLAELTHDDGTMMRRDASMAFAKSMGIPYTTIDALVLSL